MPWTQHCRTLVAAAAADVNAVAAAAGYRAHCCFAKEGTGYSGCCCCYCCLLLYLDMMDSTNYNARIVLLESKAIMETCHLVDTLYLHHSCALAYLDVCLPSSVGVFI